MILRMFVVVGVIGAVLLVSTLVFDDGAYGTCAVCGSRLPDELLADSPVATACADHEHDHDGAAPAAL